MPRSDDSSCAKKPVLMGARILLWLCIASASLPRAPFCRPFKLPEDVVQYPWDLIPAPSLQRGPIASIKELPCTGPTAAAAPVRQPSQLALSRAAGQQAEGPCSCTKKPAKPKSQSSCPPRVAVPCLLPENASETHIKEDPSQALLPIHRMSTGTHITRAGSRRRRRAGLTAPPCQRKIEHSPLDPLVTGGMWWSVSRCVSAHLRGTGLEHTF